VAFAQGPTTGVITGRVTAEGESLPGVLVVATSPALMGERTTFTTVNGDYILPNLPPGVYQTTFQLEGFQTVNREVRVSAAQESRLNVTMHFEAIEEVIMVVGEAEAISRGGTAQTTHTTELLERLPVGRSMLSAVTLTAGVHQTGPNNQITVAGAHSFENLFMVNGVVVQENLRGQPFGLFIDDAILETTTTVSGVSAEYGRFSGGVVSTITKSGGNQFEGSFRTGFTNEKWSSMRPLQTVQDDDVIPRYEATLGGPFLRDRLWFFGAGMLEERSSTEQTRFTTIPYTFNDDETRWELKLTLAATPQHQLVGSFMDSTREQSGYDFRPVPILDMRSVYDRSLPNDFWTAHYTGILTHSLFVEAKAAERQFFFKDSGARTRDIIEGTTVRDRVRGAAYWSPIFCGVCPDEERSMENYLAKGTWFLSTERAGTHNLVFGWDSYNDIRASDNHQSGSDFHIFGLTTIIRGDQVFPQWDNTGNTWIVWYPIFEPTRGTSFWTHSLYANNQWQASDRLSLNLGLRYDRNDGENAMGQKTVEDDQISPRVGLTFDLRGDGSTILNASAGRYVAAIANQVGDATSVAGQPAVIGWDYLGPAINPDPNAPNLLTTDQALNILFTWFCGGNPQNCAVGSGFSVEDAIARGHIPWLVSIPGATSGISDRLKSPSADEYSIGVSQRLGARGMVRADIVHRDFQDFYANFTNLQTIGQGPGDFSIIGNTNELERVYTGLHTQGNYRFTDRFQAGFSWSWSHARGDWNGETAGGATQRTGWTQYQEYKERHWHNPRRNLEIDQRHRAALYGMYDVLRSDRLGNLSASFVQTFRSGGTYSAVGGVDPRPYVANPGYATPPNNLSYFFITDGFKTDDVTSTDLALSYSKFFGVGNRRVELFLQPQVLNVWNEQAETGHNTTILTATNSAAFQRFNPFTETPVQGVHWDFGPDFGTPTSFLQHQTPRTFRFSVGIRI
jgi:outer membrane receptor protein involved in Fe transport